MSVNWCGVIGKTPIDAVALSRGTTPLETVTIVNDTRCPS
jgi:hypothetical protein